MPRFFKYFGIAFLAQILLLAGTIFVPLNPGNSPAPVVDKIWRFYLSPADLLLFLGIVKQSGAHGGELLFMPVSAVLYAAIFSIIIVIWQSISSSVKPRK